MTASLKSQNVKPYLRRGLGTILCTVGFLYASAVHCEGYVVYSSWATETKAEQEANNVSNLLNVSAEILNSTVAGQPRYRVVVPVESKSVADVLILRAKVEDLSAWYLVTASSPTTSQEESTPASPHSPSANGDSTRHGDDEFYLPLSPSENGEPDSNTFEVIEVIDASELNESAPVSHSPSDTEEEISQESIQVETTPAEPLQTAAPDPESDQMDSSDEDEKTDSIKRESQFHVLRPNTSSRREIIRR